MGVFMWAIVRKELIHFFSSLTAYLVMGVFLTLTGLFLWILPGNILEEGYATLAPFFDIAPWVLLFLVPAITMRFLAEERQMQTLEILVTSPVSERTILWGKFVAGLILSLAALLPTLMYAASVYWLAYPAGNVDLAGMVGAYLGLMFLVAAYLAIGIFASALSVNQIVAFVLGALIIFVFYALFDWLRAFTTFSSLDALLEYLGMQSHFTSLGRGIIDSRDVVYFLSLTVFFIEAALLAVEKRKWQ